VSTADLPVLGQSDTFTERADAARNRRRILTAAAEVFAAPPAGGVTMEAVARAAGVGRATLYRRYPDVASLALALLDEHERRLQEHILRGDPPLGPGAPPTERLAAFYAAMVALLEEHAPLLLGAEVGRSRFAPGSYRFWSSHVRVLLIAAGVEDPEPLVDILLAPLAPEIYLHQRRERGHTTERIITALTRLAEGVLGTAASVLPPR
jgi:AcrR family transcriptional regulator